MNKLEQEGAATVESDVGPKLVRDRKSDLNEEGWVSTNKDLFYRKSYVKRNFTDYF